MMIFAVALHMIGLVIGPAGSQIQKVKKDWCENDEFCIKTKELCIKNEEFCIKNDDFCSRGVQEVEVNKQTGAIAVRYIYI